jgi:Subtilase family
MLSMALPARRAGVLALAVAIALILVVDASPARADSVRNAQAWVLNAINAPGAWQISQGQGVTVAVIDSGVNPGVSDLAGSVTTGPDLTGVRTPESNPGWGVHGTWMASLIAGHGHDGGGSGITGVAPKAHVLSIRVITDSADPGFSHYEHEPQPRIQRELARAIMYAVSHGAGVISMSLGYELPSLLVRQALGYALSHNVAVFASSGNSGNAPGARRRGHAPYSFPADYPGVLGVAAVGQSGAPAGFSSDNLSVQVAAPGVSVPAQGRDGHYWLVSGTSPACALTAGVAALIRSAYPGLPPDLVREAIATTTTNRPRGGYDNEVGFGTVDAASALTAAARLSARGMAGPGAPRTGLRKTAAAEPGLGLGGHFGGGPGAVPPEPVGPRGVGQLLLFCLLAACCLAMIVVATSRLILMRRPATLTRRWQYGPVAPAATWPGPEPGLRAPGIPQRANHQNAPRFPWSAPPPGRHAALHDRQRAPGNPGAGSFAPGSSGAGSSAPGSSGPAGSAPGSSGPAGSAPGSSGPAGSAPESPSPRDFASADYTPGNLAWGSSAPGGSVPGDSTPTDFAPKISPAENHAAENSAARPGE